MMNDLISMAHSAAQFLQGQLDCVYMFYGISAILMIAICRIVMVDRKQRLAWKWLGLFSIFNSICIVLDIFTLTIRDTVILSAFRLGLTAISLIFLFEFGRDSLKRLSGKGPGIWIYIPLSAFVLLGFFEGIPGLNATVRYMFGLIGGLWSAYILYRVSGIEKTARGASIFTAAMMAGYAVVIGIIVPQAAFPPASVINDKSFGSLTGIPVQLIEGLLIALITAGIWTYNKKSLQMTSPVDKSRRKSYDGIILILVSIAILAAGWIFTVSFGKNAGLVERNDLLNQTKIAAASLAPEDVAQLTGKTSDIGTDGYKRLRQRLMIAKNTSGNIRWLYLMYLEKGKIWFTVVSVPEGEYGYVEPGEAYYEQPPEGLFRIFETGAALSSGPYTDEWGTFLSGFAAIRDPSTQKVIGVLGIDINAFDYIRIVGENRLIPICITFLIYLIFIVFFLSYKRILESARLISDGGKILKETQKAAGIGSWIYDVRTGKYNWSKEMIDIFGIDSYGSYQNGGNQNSSDQNSGEQKDFRFDDLIYPKDFAAFDSFVSKVISEKKESGSELLINLKSGAIPYRYIHSKARIITGRDGDVIQILGTSQDVTERREAEELIQESRDSLKQVLETASFPIVIILKASSTHIYSNRAAKEFFEVTDETFQDYINKTLIADLANIKEFRTESKEKGFVDSRELQIKTMTGKVKWVIASNRPIIYDRQECFVSIQIDITRLKETEEMLKNAKDDADRANAAKSEFLANMSHEIRTPLNAIIGFSELLFSLVSDIKHKSYVESINIAGKSLLTLINDILDLSKIEAGMMEIRMVPVNPRVVFEEIEQIFKQKVYNKGLQFITEIDKELPEALILDETRLRQVLLNLVGNAVKFTDEGYIKLSAQKVYTDVKDNSKLDLIITIEDTGIGIPEDSYKMIFESFRQQSGQNSRKYEGTGLGLSISRRLVHLMNGEISLKSEMGKGSSFIISLHNVAVASIDTLKSKVQEYSYRGIIFEKANVMVVDDIESNRRLIKEMLGRTGLEVITAENGLEALHIAEDILPDVILMDIKMPVMDGIEATIKLRSNPRTKNIHIIALTASVVARDNVKIGSDLFEACIIKPVTFNMLVGELTKYLKYQERVETGRELSAESVAEISLPSESEIQPGFILLMREQAMPLVKKLGVALKMTDAKKLAFLLAGAGRQYKYDALQQAGDSLAQSIKCFNISEIKNKLKDISKFLENILAKEGNNK